MKFCKVIGNVLSSWFPNDVKLLLFDLVFQPIGTHVNHLHQFLFCYSLNDIVYSTIISVIGVAGCGWPRTMKQIQSGMASFAFMYRLPISVSTVDVIKFLIIHDLECR